MNEKLESYKAELVYPQEVTEELITGGYLVGIYNLDRDSVVVVKNRMNEVTGEIPASMWRALVEDLEVLRAKKETEEAEETEEIEKSEEDYLNELNELSGFSEIFNPVFNSIGKSFYEIRPKVEQTQDEVIAKGKIIFKNLIEEVERLTKEMQPKVQEVTEDIKEKAVGKAKRAKLTIKRKRLENILDEADVLGVLTNGLIKKVNKKIAAIDDILGE